MEIIEERKTLKGPKIMQDCTGSMSRKGIHNEIPPGVKFEEWEGYLHSLGPYRQAPKYSFSGKRDNTSKRGEYKTPGPGAYDPFYYDPDTDQRIEGHTPMIGTSLRPTLDKKNNVPGPGHYRPKHSNMGNEHRFGNTLRMKDLDMDDPDILPGPGKYNIEHSIPQIQYWQQNQMNQMGLKISMELPEIKQ